MILVYSPKITNRIDYACSLLLGNILKADWELTNNTDRFLNFNGPKINYSNQSFKEKALNIPAHGFMLERGIHSYVPDIEWNNELPMLFPLKGKNDTGFDALSASFYLVSRYEEYLPHKKDIYGRFEAIESFAFRHNFLKKPVVNHYALIIKKKLLNKFPGYKFANPAFSYIPTYDIDVAYAYRGRGFLRSLLGTMRSLAQLEMNSLAERYRVITGNQQDPYDTYDHQLSLSKKYNIKAFYFILCGNYAHHDKNIAFYSKALFSLVKRLGDYAYIGLHPSFASNDDTRLINTEAERLGKILNQEIQFSRQHFLKLQIPKTYQNLLKHNFSHDFTMGYASQPGFRAGICTPFNYYDIESESITPLKVMPLTVMDTTLIKYLKLSHEGAINVFKKLLHEVEQTGGTFISLWHNDTLCNCGMWKGWRDVYDKLFEMASAKHQKPYDPIHRT